MSKLVVKKNPYLWEETLEDEESGESFELKFKKRDVNNFIKSIEGIDSTTELGVKAFFSQLLSEEDVERIYKVLVLDKDDDFYTADEMIGAIVGIIVGKLGARRNEAFEPILEQMSPQIQNT